MEHEQCAVLYKLCGESTVQLDADASEQWAVVSIPWCSLGVLQDSSQSTGGVVHADASPSSKPSAELQAQHSPVEDKAVGMAGQASSEGGSIGTGSSVVQEGRDDSQSADGLRRRAAAAALNRAQQGGL